MSHERHRLKSPTLALLEEGGRHVARTVPTGDIVIVDGPFVGDKLVEALCDEKR